MTITGGYIYVNASGDGVDSNSTWEMSGGTLLVCGPTSGGDGSLDADGNMTYTGGTLLALSSKGMMEYPESGCLIATNCNAAAGEQISIVDKNGTVLATLQSPKAVSDVIYGIGDSDSADYTIVTGGTYDGTLNEDGYGEGGSVSGGTEVTANGGHRQHERRSTCRRRTGRCSQWCTKRRTGRHTAGNAEFEQLRLLN